MERKKTTKQKTIDGSKLKITIVVSSFNEDITSAMLKGAVETLEKSNLKKKNIKIVWVPWSFEIPLACQKLAQTKKYDGLIALGCVIKGDTDHHYYIANESIHGVMDVMLKNNLRIGMGIITTNNLKQAQDRSGKINNKGTEAAEAVLASIIL